jgi:hypothetical protein
MKFKPPKPKFLPPKKRRERTKAVITFDAIPKEPPQLNGWWFFTPGGAQIGPFDTEAEANEAMLRVQEAAWDPRKT